ncbi:hypothetical protein evm_005180 [Chilo suppressalis]|nr:hypothetical protein evm_005180 [Chilo suppressalis]
MPGSSPIFIRSRQGGVLLCIGGFTFSKQRRTCNKTRWICSSHCNKKYPIYIRSRQGGVLLCIGGFTFCKNRKYRNKTRWLCSTHSNKKCKAVVYTLGDTSEVIKCRNVHNHEQRGDLIV